MTCLRSLPYRRNQNNVLIYSIFEKEIKEINQEAEHLFDALTRYQKHRNEGQKKKIQA